MLGFLVHISSYRCALALSRIVQRDCVLLLSAWFTWIRRILSNRELFDPFLPPPPRGSLLYFYFYFLRSFARRSVDDRASDPRPQTDCLYVYIPTYTIVYSLRAFPLTVEDTKFSSTGKQYHHVLSASGRAARRRFHGLLCGHCCSSTRNTDDRLYSLYYIAHAVGFEFWNSIDCVPTYRIISSLHCTPPIRII